MVRIDTIQSAQVDFAASAVAFSPGTRLRAIQSNGMSPLPCTSHLGFGLVSRTQSLALTPATVVLRTP